MQSNRLNPYLTVLKRSWGGEQAVYLTESRETHLLNAYCARVVGVLEQGPALQDALMQSLQEFLPDAQVQDLSSLLDEILDTLSRIGIVEATENTS